MHFCDVSDFNIPFLCFYEFDSPIQNFLINKFCGDTFYHLLLLQTLIMGNRDDIDEMSGTNASVLLSILKLIDKYDLYGQVAYPKHHKQSDVPDIYRLAAKTKV